MKHIPRDLSLNVGTVLKAKADAEESERRTGSTAHRQWGWLNLNKRSGKQKEKIKPKKS